MNGLFDEIKCYQCHQPLETSIIIEHDGHDITWTSIYIHPHECTKEEEEEE